MRRHREKWKKNMNTKLKRGDGFACDLNTNSSKREKHRLKNNTDKSLVKLTEKVCLVNKWDYEGSRHKSLPLWLWDVTLRVYRFAFDHGRSVEINRYEITIIELTRLDSDFCLVFNKFLSISLSNIISE